nr:synaptobrevin, longin-like domain protein [Tanacetum cinerariifolium]
MVAILENGEFNTDFHPMVDFIAASPLRYALTVKPIIFVSHIQQFWSTARIETTDEGTHILAIMDGIQRTVSEASLRHNLKLRDEDGIVSISDMELFENLTLMGYNISQNQKLTFQKGQFSHQWKYLIHTIMQCLSPKSTGFNEFSSNIATALVCLATNRTYNFSKMIFDGMVKNAQEEEIGRLKERVQVLEDRDVVATKQSGEDAPIKGRSNNEGEAATERISNDSEEIARVLTSMDAATILAGEINIPTGSGFIPTAGPHATIISTSSKKAGKLQSPDEIINQGISSDLKYG